MKQACKKMISLYPVRYAVKGENEGQKPAYLNVAAGGKLEKSFPDLKSASYTIQTIPQDYYILIVEGFGGNPFFRLFHNNSKRGGFIEVDWKKHSQSYSKNPKANPIYTGIAKSYISINHQATTLHVGLSEHLITPRIGNKLTGAFKSKVMLQEIPLSSWAKCSPSQHTFHIDSIEDILEEFKNSGEIIYHKDLPSFKTVIPYKVGEDMKIEYTPEQLADPTKDQRIVIALYDPVGITEDLNAFVGIQQKKIQDYVEKEGDKYTSGKLVTDYVSKLIPHRNAIKEQQDIAAEKTREQFRYNRYRNILIPKELEKSKQEIIERMRDPIERAYSCLNHGKAGMNAIYQHRREYEAKIKQLEPDILSSASDALTWAKQIVDGKCVERHLAIHDHECPVSWQYYEQQVSNCIASLINTRQGEKFVFELIEKIPEESPFWKALGKGDAELWTDLLDALNTQWVRGSVDIASSISDYGVQQETTLLSSFLKPFLTKKIDAIDLYMARLSTVAKYRIGHIITKQDISIPVAYNLAVNYLHEEQNLGGVNLKTHQQALLKIQEKLQLKMTTIEPTIVTVPLYTLQKIGKIQVFEYKPLSAPSLSSNNPLRKRLQQGLGFTSDLLAIVAAIASGVTVEKTIAKINDGNENTMAEKANLWAAALNFSAASTVLIGVGVRIYQHRAATNIAIIKTTQKRFIIFSGYVGAGASAISAVADGMKANEAFKLHDSDSAYSRVAASTLNGFAAIGTTAATITATTNIALVLGPVGWLVLAIVLAGAAAYCATEADDKKDSPEEFWLKHSSWGINPKLGQANELEVFYKAFFKPRVTATNWEDIIGADVLTLSFYLPHFQKEKSVFEWKDAISANLNGKALTPHLFEHGKSYVSKLYRDVDWEKEFRIYEQIEVGQGFAIVVIAIHVHDNAKVKLAYNYYPSGVEAGVILIHDKQGLDWVFGDDYVFKNTTDNDKLDVISAPDRLQYITN